MRQLLFLLFPIITSCFISDPHPSLFLITVNGKYGFIDRKGKEVIPPIFYAAGEFSEGLAPARKGGMYGYINAKGEYEIPPQFEYALPFEGDFAIVYTARQPSYIDRQGKRPFETSYKEISNFINGRAKVITYTEKHGFINTSGKLIIDTAFKTINPFIDGLAVVEGLDHDKEIAKGKYKKEVGVIDSLGRFVVPYGRFDAIKDYHEGYAYFDINEKDGDEDGETAQGGFIDRTGKVVMSRYNKNNSWIQGSIYNGLARISLYKHWIPDSEGTLWSSEKSYEGYIDLNGNIVFSDTSIVNSTEFSEGRAFVGEKFGEYYLIDTSGKRVSKNTFKRVSDKGFVNGVAFVQKDYRWGLINTKGEYVVEAKYGEISEALLNERYFSFSEEVKDAKGLYQTRYGIASVEGNVIIKPVLKEYDRRGFVNGLLRGWIDESLVYMDSGSKIVWISPKENKNEVRKLNIDYMNRGYFYAEQIEKYKTYDEIGKPIKASKVASIENIKQAIMVTIDTSKSVLLNERYKGFALTIRNTATLPIHFNAQDSRLNLKLQALTTKGEWKDIEYLPNSWCGNSYHTITLKPKQSWQFVIPQYEGAIQTKLRAELRFIDPGNPKSEIVIYSNELNGSVNPAQFWRQAGYSPSGIMDPYNE